MSDDVLSGVAVVRLGIVVLLACGAVWCLIVATVPLLRRRSEERPSAAHSAVAVAGAASWAALAFYAMPTSEVPIADVPTVEQVERRSDESSQELTAEALEGKIDVAVEEYFAKLASDAFQKFRKAVRAPSSATASGPFPRARSTRPLDPLPPKPGQKYIIREGESLAQIAIRCYGDIRHWRKIVEANPWIEPDRLLPGDMISLPKIYDGS